MSNYFNVSSTTFEEDSSSFFYQDRSLLILEMNRLMANADCRFVCLTRPRRFGKTMALEMLNAYYSKAFDSRELFSKLKIGQYNLVTHLKLNKKFEVAKSLRFESKFLTNEETANLEEKIANIREEIKYKKYNFLQNLNKFNVIKIDLNYVCSAYQNFKKSLPLTDNNYLYQRRKSIDPSINLESFNTRASKYSLIDFLKLELIHEFYSSNLEIGDGFYEPQRFFLMLQAIAEKTHSKFVVLIDEWDVIFRDPPYAQDQELKNEYVDFLRHLFKDAPNKQNIALAYITGILPIQKYYSESALNNFTEYSMLDPNNLGQYFGFLQSEVKFLCKQHNMSFKEVTSWYNGYYLDREHLYNPYAIVQAILKHSCQNYWIKTSASTVAFNYIFGIHDQQNAALSKVQNDIVDMMLGKEIEVNIARFDGNPLNVHEPDQLYALLICLGYLTSKPIKNESEKRLVKIPNLEIASALRSEMRNHMHDQDANASIKKLIETSNSLFNAITVEQDQERVAHIVQEFHNNSSENISVKEYNDESALRFMIQMLLLFSTADRYRVEKEAPSGLGFADLIYIPNNERHPALIIELKMDSSPDLAIKQIKDKDYMQKVRHTHCKEAFLVGISYDRKTKQHQCKIERVGE